MWYISDVLYAVLYVCHLFCSACQLFWCVDVPSLGVI